MTFDMALVVAVAAATLRLAIPVAVAALGELINERAGVLNLGVEGSMLVGAYAGYTAALAAGSAWVGLIVGIVVGALAGTLLATLMVGLGTNQIVTGLAFTILASAVTTFLFELSYTIGAAPPRVVGLGLPQLVAVTLVCLLLVWFWLERTNSGMRLGAVGEEPVAAETLGIPVIKTRFLALIGGNALAGLAGALLVCGPLGIFVQDVTAGRGWIALALVVFARWKPVPVLLGSLLFGFCDAMRLRLQTVATDVPYELFLALPYLVTIAALVIGGRARLAPAALGTTFHPRRTG
ncbi:ABC transporter permease [Naumannella halotolerans]|uniref:Simple sugar transport system permease protein n=1 Tax=Naumannella halotolerans TaxID=993414 RepID=A0A4R7JAC9_9ACTN|nr:ABC transporter permease [Naumannella halotolerans]TDT33577.1 simple sugar transport system permease protein [Naumannella halotolerans]